MYKFNKPIAQLFQSVVNLYETLGVEPEKVELEQPSKEMSLFDSLVSKDVTSHNLEQVNQAIVRLQKRVEERNLETWSERQTFERQKKELEQKLEEWDTLAEKNRQLNQQINTLEADKKELNVRLADAEKQHRLEKEKYWLGFAREIIQVRDNLAMKEEMLKEEDNYTETKAWKLIQSLYRETESVLSRQGITIIRKDGAFDSQLHSVSDTIPTEKEELHDTVAQTFRDGYRTAEKLIRPQEVILYSYKN